MRSTVSFFPVLALDCARAGIAETALAAIKTKKINACVILELRMCAGLPIKAAHSILPRGMRKPGMLLCPRASLNHAVAMEEKLQRACSNCAVELADDCGAGFLREIRNAPMVTASESANNEPSRTKDRGPTFSPGPKQPQLISSPSA